MQERVTYLLEQRLKQQLTMAESEELLAILELPEYEAMVADILSGMAQAEPAGPALDPVWLQKNVHGIVTMDKRRKARTIWLRYAAAAAIILLVGAGAIIYINTRRDHIVADERPLPAATVSADVPPGSTIATLTLSDGTTIALDTAADGSLARQGNTDVIKLQKGQLAYKTAMDGKPHVAGKAAYNMIATPRGGQYQVALPDGSKVWLNAASSLRFPTAFAGGSREVEVTGEAYFEIAANANAPFYVRTNAMTVEVLGTKFNVNAYADEPSVRTTLLEGSVRVRRDKAAAMLAPGQQASLTVKGNIDISKDADVEEAVAWKNGLFRLTSSDVPAIMRQLARWYDVQVEFEGAMPTGHITGEVPRSTSLSKVLKVFETSGVHFRIEGKKIVVTQ